MTTLKLSNKFADLYRTLERLSLDGDTTYGGSVIHIDRSALRKEALRDLKKLINEALKCINEI